MSYDQNLMQHNTEPYITAKYYKLSSSNFSMVWTVFLFQMKAELFLLQNVI